MGFDYITQGPPSFPAGLSPALLLDEVDVTLYVWSSADVAWIQVGNNGGANDSVQNLTTSQPISFSGSTNTFVKAVAGSGIVLTLPSAVGLNGRSAKVVMVDTGSGGVLIETILSQTINGQSFYELLNQYEAVTLESDGANWFVVATAG